MDTPPFKPGDVVQQYRTIEFVGKSCKPLKGNFLYEIGKEDEITIVVTDYPTSCDRGIVLEIDTSSYYPNYYFVTVEVELPFPLHAGFMHFELRKIG